MSKKIDFISPIAIDLGAKNTGVYFAHYPSGISLLDDEKFKKSGKVYQLEKDSYTLLMANRTAKRHQKRGYDRRQMAKRLFKLIWEKHFGLVWDKDVQQTISFLLNRRGFTFLTEEYDEEKLSQFPKTAYDLLPEELKKDVEKHGDGYDFDIALKEWVKNPDKIKNLYQELEVKIYLEKLRQACNQIQKGNYKSRKNDLSKVNKSLLDKMRKKGVQGLNDAALSGKYKWTNKRGENKELPFIYDDNINIEEYLKNNKEKIQTIKNSLPKLRQAELKSSVWSFSPESFNLEEFNLPDNENESEKRSKKFNKQSKSAGKGNNGYLKTHLHHLSFALYKTYSELGSGGRHRSKYFEEVEEVLSCQNHSHGYLKNFCKHLHQADFKIKVEKSIDKKDLAQKNIEINNTADSAKIFNKSDSKEEKRKNDTFKNFINEETLKEWKKDYENQKNKTKDIKLSKNKSAIDKSERRKKLSLPAFIEAKALSYLISHISNFELKPLRKYFNDKSHETDDYWNEAQLAEKFENWILTEWRVNPKKDRDKAKGKKGSYKKLKTKWSESLTLDYSLAEKKRTKRWKTLRKQWPEKHKGKLINFWLNTNPFLTIPPYQDNNNRRPPKCQSLILNSDYLNKNYSEWEKWLEDLKPLVKDYLGDFEEQLKSLKSKGSRSKTKKANKFSYFSDKPSSHLDDKKDYQRGAEHLKAHVLQFIFDRVKLDDPLKLNEIYSQTKRYRQLQSSYFFESRKPEEREKAKERLEKAVQNSKLPEHLKTKRDYNDKALFAKNKFLHLVCKYYKQRQRAKDGRIFIQPKYRYIKDRGYENTGHFDDKNCLLTYCNYKPRQKRYQMLEDLAGLLQVSPQKLKEHVDTYLPSQGMAQKSFNSQGKNKIRQEETLSGERESSQQNSNQPQTIDEKLLNWLKNIKGLKTNCDKAAKEQKDRRGRLKLDIQNVYDLIYHQTKNKPLPEKKSDREKRIKEILKDSKADQADKLYKLCEQAKEPYLSITNYRYRKLASAKARDDDPETTNGLYSSQEQKKWKEDLNRNPASTIYFLSQINNIAFKERTGNAKTCPVCSADNAQRMQPAGSARDSAKAQRLPAIPTRIIDGAVKRMARIVGDAIAEDKWKSIKPELEKGHKVRIPIITESNQFEFEPSREELVKNQRIGKRKSKVLERGGDTDVLTKKTDRIKAVNSQNICPYTGQKISGEGHIDHIIPRAGKRGTLNDEANLIWASKEGNQHKTNKELSLNDLKPEYKKSVFDGKDDSAIKKWIIEQIGNGEGEGFKFDQYRSFINLSPDEQKAFRHALFLNGHPLREKVINAIDNRNRALVNGTQRYFSEVLSNKIYKKVLAWNANPENKRIDIKNLSFDYFGVSAYERGLESIKFIRGKLESAKDSSGKPLYPELQSHIKPQDKPENQPPQDKKAEKKKNEPQTVYSHLIDAQIAFMLALSQHQKEGSFKIDGEADLLSDSYSHKNLNSNTDTKLYEKIKISKESTEEDSLERKAVDPKEPTRNRFAHRCLFNSNPGSWKFLKLIEIKTNASPSHYLLGFLNLKKLKECLNNENLKEKIKKEYCHNNKIPYAKSIAENKIIELYSCGKGKHQFGFEMKKQEPIKIKGKNIIIHQINKTKVAEFLLKHFHTKSNPSKWAEEDCNVLNLLLKLWYHTSKKKISEPKDIVLPNDKVNDLFNISLYQSWQSLKEEWEKQKEKVDFNKFLQQQFLYYKKEEIKRRGLNGKNKHQKTRKIFSLPVVSKRQGWFLVKRKSWVKQKNKGSIYQCLSESNSISKFSSSKNETEILTEQYRQKSIFLFPKSNKGVEDLKSKLSSSEDIIPAEKWHERHLEEFKELKPFLIKLENKTGKDSRRAWFRLTFKNKPKFNSDFVKVIKFFGKRSIKQLSFEKYETEDIEKKYKAVKTEINDKNKDIKKAEENLKSVKKENASQKKEIEKIENLLKKIKTERKSLKENEKCYEELKKLFEKVQNRILIFQGDKPFKLQ